MINQIKQNIEKYSNRDAFVINEMHYSYAQFAQYVSNIRSLIDSLSPGKNEIIAVVTYDNIETYATIYALWFSGLCFLPINPLLPKARNQEIIDQTNIRFIINSKAGLEFTSNRTTVEEHSTAQLPSAPINLTLPALSDKDLMYILFTSGSTGVPKGVPINRENLNGFVNGFFANGYSIDENDRFLQMFDFTFDISVQCYVLPLFVGASIYTIPLDNVKFFTIYQILEKHQITVAKMVPSVIAFLRPYFKKLKLPHLKYSLFSGEALYNDLINEWSTCVPNALIQNYYGPTEATIDCLYYTWDKNLQSEKTYNGIMAIGKPFGDTKAIIMDENGKIISDNKKGELCVAGSQVTTGYLNLPEKNKSAFIHLNYEGEECVFYRTGDLVFRDNDNDYLYCGRLDNQVQVQGYRVELGELENHAKEFVGNIQVAAVAKDKSIGNMQLFLFVEKSTVENSLLTVHLQKVLPYYMLPSKIIVLETIPLTSNGKIDRKKLAELI